MFSDIKVWPTKNNEKVKANVSFVVNNVFQIKATLFNGPKGMFVGFPGKYSEKVDENTGKKIFYADVKCTDEARSKELNELIIKAYEEKLNPSSKGNMAPPF